MYIIFNQSRGPIHVFRAEKYNLKNNFVFMYGNLRLYLIDFHRNLKVKILQSLCSRRKLGMQTCHYDPFILDAKLRVANIKRINSSFNQFNVSISCKLVAIRVLSWEMNCRRSRFQNQGITKDFYNYYNELVLVSRTSLKSG